MKKLFVLLLLIAFFTLSCVGCNSGNSETCSVTYEELSEFVELLSECERNSYPCEDTEKYIASYGIVQKAGNTYANSLEQITKGYVTTILNDQITYRPLIELAEKEAENRSISVEDYLELNISYLGSLDIFYLYYANEVYYEKFNAENADDIERVIKAADEYLNEYYENSND